MTRYEQLEQKRLAREAEETQPTPPRIEVKVAPVPKERKHWRRIVDDVVASEDIPAAAAAHRETMGRANARQGARKGFARLTNPASDVR